MRQALHIFRKDVRGLWLEIEVSLLVVAAFTWMALQRFSLRTGPHISAEAWDAATYLLPVAALTLIGSVIHAEALPGDRQFWRTRPYAWKSLLGAKALFLLAFVNIPMLIANAIVIRANGFSLWAEWRGVLWSQVLLTTVFVLPVAALSVLTRRFVQLLFAILILAAAVVAWSIAAPWGGLGAWGALDWIRSTYAIGLIGIATLAIVTWQYARRKTTAARSVGSAAWAIMLLGMAWMPWTAAFAIQSRLSKERVDPSSLNIRFDSVRSWLAGALPVKGDRMKIDLPLLITGIPEGRAVKSDGFSVSIESQDGSAWRAEPQPWGYVTSEGPATTLETTVPGSFYRKVKDEPVTIRGALYLTVFGNPQTARIPFDGRPGPVSGVGLCSAQRGDDGKGYFVLCAHPFRSAPGLVSVNFEDFPSIAHGESISYSPFPAELSFSPVSLYHASSYKASLAAALITNHEPLAHIRRDFELGGVHLGDFEARQKQFMR